jgi:hypothetical protein
MFLKACLRALQPHNDRLCKTANKNQTKAHLSQDNLDFTPL